MSWNYRNYRRKNKFHIAEQLKLIANSFESKELFMKNDIKIKTEDGVKIISSGRNTFNLRSSKCEIAFLRNDSKRCKHCRIIFKFFYNIINRSSHPTTNHSKYIKINIVSKNPVSADFQIRNNQNVDFNLHRKVTKMKYKGRPDQLGQHTN